MKLIKKLFGFFWDRSLPVFLIIGGLNTLAAWAINYALNVWAGWHFFWSSTAAFAITSVFSFYFNRRYSFKSRAPLGPSILRFSIIVTGCFLLSYGLNELVLPVLRAGAWRDMNGTLYFLIRMVALQVVFTALNYLGQRLWAFKARPESPPPAEGGAEPQ